MLILVSITFYTNHKNITVPRAKRNFEWQEIRKDYPKKHSYVWIENINPESLKRTHYVILSASVPNFSNNTNYINEHGQAESNSRAWGYIFQIPNTARAWNKIGYTVVVMITIDYPNLTANAKSLLSVVEYEIKKIGIIAIYISVPSHTKVRLAQLLRLVPSAINLFPEESFLMISDAEIWPGSKERYQIASNKTIHITNSMCCDVFTFKSKIYRQFPMTSIGMTKKLWNQLLPFKKFFNIDEHITFDYIGFYEYLKSYANGQNIDSPAKHGGTLWNIDQVYISIMIGDYINTMGEETMSYYPHFRCPRIDIWHLKEISLTTCFDDAHIYKEEPWLEAHWNEMKTLMRCLHSATTVQQMNFYAENFRKTFDKLKPLEKHLM